LTTPAQDEPKQKSIQEKNAPSEFFGVPQTYFMTFKLQASVGSRQLTLDFAAARR
jgi:hypothetical protein